MNRFLAIGECMIEMSVAGDGLYRMGFAGDTFNTAWYLRRLLPPGVEVAYLSAVGDDAPSRRMEGFMRDAGLVPELAVREGGAVGLYMISLKDGERSFSYWRANSAARSLADDLDALGLAGRFHAVVNSSEAGLRKPAPEMFERALEAGGVLTDEALFVDDERRNVEAAAALGIVAHRFTGHEALAAFPGSATRGPGPL